MTRFRYALTLLFFAVAGLGGCERRCEGLSPQVEVSLSSGGGVNAGSIKGFKATIRLHGGPELSRLLTLKEAGFSSGGGGRFVIFLERGPIPDNGSLELKIQACSQASCAAGSVLAQGRPDPNPVELQANGCNTATVQLVKNNGGGGPVLALATSKADIEVLGQAKDDGLSSVVACDLDGKGGADIVVAAPNAKDHSDTGLAAGRVYVLLNGTYTKGTPKTEDLAKNGAGFIKIYGVKNDHLGGTLACVDLDGDIYQDLLIGAPDADGQRGKVYVLKGSPNWLNQTINLGDNTHKKDVVELLGANKDDELGRSLAVVNLLGNKDPLLAVGAPGFSPGAASTSDGGTADSGALDGGVSGRAQAGAVYLIPASSLTEGASIDLATQTLAMVWGAVAGERLGAALAAGDLDKDGKDELAMGGPGAKETTGLGGVVRVLAGRASLAAGFRLDSAADKDLVNLWGVDKDASFGESLATGDMAAAGNVDLLVGDPLKARVYVFTDLGGKLVTAGAASVDLNAADTYKARYLGPSDSSSFGAALATMPRSGTGDAADLVVGAPAHDSGKGSVYWLRRVQQGFGKQEPIDVTNTKDLLLRVTGAAAQDRLGSQVSGGFLRDMKIPDILMVAPGAGGARSASGVAYGMLGTK